MKKLLSVILAAVMLCGCAAEKETVIPDLSSEYPDAQMIVLNGDSATVNGEKIAVSDYTWHIDPAAVHDENEKAPAEYHTGTEMDGDLFIDHDLAYMPFLNEDGFALQRYGDDQEWVYHYQDGVNDEFIFVTLPDKDRSFPDYMMHSEEEALENSVLHIRKGGTYVLSGSFNGQIAVELEDDETVELVLANANIECSVAPAIVFFNAYECGGEFSDEFSTEEAGVTLIIEEGTDNHISGSNIYRMLSNEYKKESTEQKKIRKIDAPLYSFVTMNIRGSGKLTVDSSFEGIDSEMHLSVYDGSITINSRDDGMNVNEDNVSVISFLGGTVEINRIGNGEGDGIDSNGYIIVDGGTISVNGVVSPDNALDSEDGIRFDKGTVIIDGETNEIKAGTYHEINGPNQGFRPGGRPENGQRPEEMPGPVFPKDKERPEMPFDERDRKEERFEKRPEMPQ